MPHRKLVSFESSDTSEGVISALAAGHFGPYFQPIVLLVTGELIGLEILARWLHPQAGLILPDGFIPHAEKYEWIDALTSQILSNALACVSSLPVSVSLSINI
jgi:EAL domain-containing protein (putative c-di-GMP-specific phosphodiesterase class I)